MASLADSVAKVSLQASSEGVEDVRDPYRDHLSGAGETDTVWRHGHAPRYEQVNTLFESGRTQVWPKGSLEEVVQNLVKTWEMELSHKTRVEDFKSIDHERFRISVNGGPKLSAAETLRVGSYNALLATSSSLYQSANETFESSHDLFRTAFPSGFAWEVLAVYSPPPLVVVKYRHWGRMDGSFQGHAPTGEVVESVGILIAQVDEHLKILDLEVYYDTAAFLGALAKGPRSGGCPYLKSSLLQ